MSRSLKKSPYSGFTCATSEKADKRLAHGALRAHFRTEVESAKSLDEIEFNEVNHAHSDNWCFAKDGRQRLDVNVRREGRALRVLSSSTYLPTERAVHKALGK